MQDHTKMFAAQEDSDIKIAGMAQEGLDAGEIAAREFAEQKENGNIEKAYVLGRRLAELLFTTNEILLGHSCKQLAAKENIRDIAQVLFAFVADISLECECPNSITAQTAINYLHERVQEKSPETYANIIENPAFSLFLLCWREGKLEHSNIGMAFADACDMEEEKAVIKLGNALFKSYSDICRDEIKQAGFV